MSAAFPSNALGCVVLLLTLATLASAGEWTDLLVVQACDAPLRQLPRDTEALLEATLIVQRDDVSGSAVLISPDGFALTTAHVVGRAGRVEVVRHDGGRQAARVVRVDEVHDVALVKLDGTVPCARPWLERPVLGSDVYVLGSPGGEVLSFSVSKGIVSGFREANGRHFLQMDASVNPGSSGGPVVDMHGRVVGLASWKVTGGGTEGLAFAVPTDTVVTALDLQPGTRSTLDLDAASGRRELPSEQRLDSGQRQGPGGSQLIVVGGVIGALGAVAVVSTAAVYWSAPPLDADEWQSLVTYNSLGWVALVGGGGLLVSGLFVDSTGALAIGTRW